MATQGNARSNNDRSSMYPSTPLLHGYTVQEDLVDYTEIAVDRQRIERTDALMQGCTTPPGEFSQRKEAMSSPTPQASPDGGILLRFTETTQTLPTAREASHHLANSARRRTRNESLLLQSPARRGYTDRMKQIFQDAGQVVPSHYEAPNLYPQLPSISRRVSPQRTQHTGGIALDFTNPYSRANDAAIMGILTPNDQPAPSSERSADSWTDDSGYIHAELKARSRLSSRNIHTWLSTVTSSKPEGESQDHATSPVIPKRSSVNLRQPQSNTTGVQTKVEKVDQTRPSCTVQPRNLLQHAIATSVNDPFVEGSGRSLLAAGSAADYDPKHRVPSVFKSQRHISDVCKKLDFDHNRIPSRNTGFSQVNLDPKTPEQEKDDIELTPLSPNVCIERGLKGSCSKPTTRYGKAPTNYKGSSPHSWAQTPPATAKENSPVKGNQQYALVTGAPTHPQGRYRFWEPPGR